MADPLNPNSYGPQAPQGSQGAGQDILGALTGGVPGTNIRLPQPVQRPVADVTAVLKEGLDSIDPEMAYLIDSIGQNVGTRSNADLLMQQAFQNGETTNSMRTTVRAAEATDSALKMAEQSMQMSDEEFNQFLGQMQSEIANPPALPVPGQVQQPGRLEQGLAAILSLATPEFAFSIGSVPYQNQTRIRDEAYQQAVQRYGADMAQRAQRMDLLDTRLKMAERRRSEAADEVRRLADQAYREGEVKRGQALNLRAQLYDAKTEAELDDRMSVLRTQFPPEYWPGAEAVKGIRESIRQGEQALKDKARFDRDKADADFQNKATDDFRQWVDSNYPTGTSLGQAELKAIREEAKRQSEVSGVPLSKFPVYSARTAPATENANLAQTRFDKITTPMLGISQEYLKLAQDREKRAVDTAAGKDPTKATKRRRLEALTTKIQNAKIDLDSLLNQPAPSDPDEKAKYTRKIQEAWAQELAVVQLKRKEAGGKVPTAEEYLKERFPGVVKAFAPFNPFSGSITPSGTRAGPSKKGASPGPPPPGFKTPPGVKVNP